MATGGSIVRVSVDGTGYAVAADADANRDLGGWEVDKAPNGDSTARTLKTRKPWQIDGVSLVCDDAVGGQETLQDIADAGVDVPIVVELASGDVYSGDGLPCGEIKMSTANVTMPLTFKGPGKLRKQ